MQKKIIKIAPATVEFDLFPTRLNHDAIARLDMAFRPLKPKVRKLVWAYLRGLSPTQAAITAGYSRYFDAKAVLAYPAVQNAIAVAQAVLAESEVSTIHERQSCLTRIHRGTVGDFVELSPTGNVDLRRDADLRNPALKSVVVKKGKHGEVETKIEVRDPVPAIDALNRIEGVYREKDNSGEKVVVILDYRRTRDEDAMFDEEAGEPPMVAVRPQAALPPVSTPPPGGGIVNRGAKEADKTIYIP